MVDIIIGLSAFVAAVFLAAWGIYASHNKPLSLRFLYAAIGFGVFAALSPLVNHKQTEVKPQDKSGKDNAYRNYSISHVKPPQGYPVKVVKRLTKPIQSALTSHQKTQSQLPINAPNNQGNMAIGNSAPVHQSIVNEAPPPKFNLQPIKENVLMVGAFVSEYILTIDAKIPLKSLHIELKSPFLLSFKYEPFMKNGGIIMDSSGYNYSSGYTWYNIQNPPFSKCKLLVSTSKPTKLKFDISYE